MANKRFRHVTRLPHKKTPRKGALGYQKLRADSADNDDHFGFGPLISEALIVFVVGQHD